MKLTFHVPTQQYGFLEIEGTEADRKEMETLYNTYAENKLPFKTGNFIEIETFTGEKIRYDEENHIYEDLAGNRLVGGSTYAESKVKPFDVDMIAPKVAKKVGVPVEEITAMWAMNGKISRDYGSVVHLLVEQWFKFSGHNTVYHEPKSALLKSIIEGYPAKESNMLTEVLVSDVKARMVGRIDLLEIIDMEKKIANIRDVKTDSDVKKNLEKHSWQLGFYATILTRKGWTIEKLLVDNFAEGGWTTYELEKKEIR
jgi:hypothetical protein